MLTLGLHQVQHQGAARRRSPRSSYSTYEALNLVHEHSAKKQGAVLLQYLRSSNWGLNL